MKENYIPAPGDLIEYEFDTYSGKVPHRGIVDDCHVCYDHVSCDYASVDCSIVWDEGQSSSSWYNSTKLKLIERGQLKLLSKWLSILQSNRQKIERGECCAA